MQVLWNCLRHSHVWLYEKSLSRLVSRMWTRNLWPPVTYIRVPPGWLRPLGRQPVVGSRQWWSHPWGRRCSAALKVVVVHPILKKLSLDPTALEDFHPVSNLEKVVGLQVQRNLEEIDYLDPFLLRFRLGYNTDILALIVLAVDLQQNWDRRDASILTIPDLSVAFSTINHCILLN